MDKKQELQIQLALKEEVNTFIDEIERLTENGPLGKVLSQGNSADNQDAGGRDGGDQKEAKPKTPGRKQFKELMDAAGKASSVEELQLFLSYQQSRNQGWDTICGDKYTIAETVALSLNKILKEVEGKIDKKISKMEIATLHNREIRLMIAEKYLGYLYWKATTIIKGTGGQ